MKTDSGWPWRGSAIPSGCFRRGHQYQCITGQQNLTFSFCQHFKSSFPFVLIEWNSNAVQKNPDHFSRNKVEHVYGFCKADWTIYREKIEVPLTGNNFTFIFLPSYFHTLYFHIFILTFIFLKFIQVFYIGYRKNKSIINKITCFSASFAVVMQQRQIESQSRQEALHTILISLRLSGELNFRLKFLKIFFIFRII